VKWRVLIEKQWARRQILGDEVASVLQQLLARDSLDKSQHDVVRNEIGGETADAASRSSGRVVSGVIFDASVETGASGTLRRIGPMIKTYSPEPISHDKRRREDTGWQRGNNVWFWCALLHFGASHARCTCDGMAMARGTRLPAASLVTRDQRCQAAKAIERPRLS
jgi:hypothetical protein